jgi:hypothetical protein
MGYFRQHTIVVTSCGKDIEAAHQKAVEIFGVASAILDAPANFYRSFFVPPDGSKEGWDTSNAWDAKRDDFVDWMRSYRADEEDVEWDSNGLEWVEVQFADDSLLTKVVRSSDHNAKSSEPDETL